MADSTLSFTLLARDQASSQFDHLASSVDRSGDSVSKWGDRARTAMRVGAVALAGGLALVAKGAVDAARAAAEDEASQVKLATVSRNAADATQAQVSAQEDWISAQGRALGVADDELRPALGRLIATTHDLGEAQDTAALAMDISAGTGRSLKSVTDALAKAQNGSLGGLSRLGVQIENNDGSTRSLRDITQELASTYRGAASDAADTAQGRFERMQLALDETKEAIGARLLPIMGTMADFVLTNVIPRVDSFVSGMEDGTGAGGQFADMLGKARDAAGDFARVGGGFVDIVEAVPGPLRSAGIESAAMAGAVALIAPRATAAVAAVTALTASSGGLVATQARLATLMRGGAAAVGVGAIALGNMIDTSNETGRALSTLANVGGGALLGFAVGGPVGAAVGGLAGVMTTLMSSNDETAASFWRNRDAADSFADTLDQTTGAVTQQTRQQVLLSLQNRNLIDESNTLGIRTRDLISAVLGEEDAVGRVGQAMRRGQRGTGDMVNASSALQLALFGVEGQMDATGRKGVGLSDDFRKQQREVRRNADAVATWREALAGVPKEVRTTLRNMGYQATRKEVEELRRQYDLTPKQVRTILQALNVDGTRRDLGKVQGDADKLDRTRPKPLVELLGLAGVERTKGAVQRNLVELDRAHATPTVTVNAASALSNLRSILGNLSLIRDKSVTITTYHRDYGRQGIGDQVGTNAEGTGNWRGGRTWVGEHGPEIVELPRGTRIRNATESAKMVAEQQVQASSSGASVVVNMPVQVTVDGSRGVDFAVDELIRALRARRRELGGVPLGIG